jgi:thioredoxin 1
MVKIEIFTLPGCARCNAGLDALKEVATSFGPGAFAWEERNLLQNIDDAVRLGILSAPAIAVDGKLAFASLPSPQQLQAELSRHVGS